MPGTIASLYVTSIPGLVTYLLIWIVLVECARILVRAYRNDPLVGWAVGPLGVSTLYLSEPSPVFILFNALFPAVVSAFVLYLGLFTALPSPLTLPNNPLVEILVITCGVKLVSYAAFNCCAQVGLQFISPHLAYLTCANILDLIRQIYYSHLVIRFHICSLLVRGTRGKVK